MDNLIIYIKQCLKTNNPTEFIETNSFDYNKFNNLRQDGFMIVRGVNSIPVNNPVQSEYISVGDYHIYKKAIRDLEWYYGPNNFVWEEDTQPLYRRLLPPPDETVDHTFIIESFINTSGIKNTTYIEYGVRSGVNLSKIGPLVEKSIGVDIENPSTMAPNSTFYKISTDQFSEVVLPNIYYHFAFIDADHKFDQVIKDFDNIYKYIQPGGYIFLHDTYPCHPVFLEPGRCNDCYKTPIEIKKRYPGVNILTFPLNPGVTVIRKPLIN